MILFLLNLIFTFHDGAVTSVGVVDSEGAFALQWENKAFCTAFCISCHNNCFSGNFSWCWTMRSSLPHLPSPRWGQVAIATFNTLIILSFRQVNEMKYPCTPRWRLDQVLVITVQHVAVDATKNVSQSFAPFYQRNWSCTVMSMVRPVVVFSLLFPRVTW